MSEWITPKDIGKRTSPYTSRTPLSVRWVCSISTITRRRDGRRDVSRSGTGIGWIGHARQRTARFGRAKEGGGRPRWLGTFDVRPAYLAPFPLRYAGRMDIDESYSRFRSTELAGPSSDRSHGDPNSALYRSDTTLLAFATKLWLQSRTRVTPPRDTLKPS